MISITPLEVAIGLHITRSRKQQSTCSHEPVDQDYVAGNSGKLLPEVLENIFLFADLQTLIEAAKINTIVRDATRMAFKRLVKDKMRTFFGEDIMPQFFAELRKARGYICGDVPLSIVLHAKWMLSELHLAVPRDCASELMLWIALQGYQNTSEVPVNNDGPNSLYLENVEVCVPSLYMYL